MRASVIWTLIFSMTILPGVSLSAAEKPEPLRVQNVELNVDGLVMGQLNDHTGQPIAKKAIKIQTKKDNSLSQARQVEIVRSSWTEVPTPADCGLTKRHHQSR
jgi:hypothetical protein